MDTVARFSIWDYLVLAASLLLSLAIGIFSSFTGKNGREKRGEDFYFGDGEMNIVAVAFSLAATFLSAIGLLGVPAEVYFNGTSYVILFAAEATSAIFAIAFFIPFFYKLRLTSVYEYFELRFNMVIRRCACLIFMTHMILYMALVLYAPSLALSQVSGLPIWASIIASGMVCTIYTSIGGMKAVIWTDAFQMVIMLCGVITVFVIGVISAGGVSAVHEASYRTGRTVISFDPNPTTRHTFWTLLIGGIFTIMPFSMNQATVQRYMSVRSRKSAQKMFAIHVPMALLWWSILVCLGMTMHAYYFGCDPSKSSRIEQADQMIALFVMDTLAHLKGLPGLFTAIVYSATLSTVSSGINSITVVLMEDFIKPITEGARRQAISERTVMILNKSLAFAIGILAIGLAFVASVMGKALIQFIFSIDGVLGGPLLGLFICGMLLPFVNAKGATVGAIVALTITSWIGTGGVLFNKPQPPMFLSTAYCNETHGTTSLEEKLNYLAASIASYSPVLPERTMLESIYALSYQYYSLTGFVICVTVSSLASLVTRLFGMKEKEVPARLFLFNVYKNTKATGEMEFAGYDEYGLVPKKPKDSRLDLYD